MSGANVSDLATVDGAASLCSGSHYILGSLLIISSFECDWQEVACAENELENHIFRSRLHHSITRSHFTFFSF